MKRIPVRFAYNATDEEVTNIADQVALYVSDDKPIDILGTVRRHIRKLESSLALYMEIEHALSEYLAGLNHPHWSQADNSDKCIHCASATSWRFGFQPMCPPYVETRNNGEPRCVADARERATKEQHEKSGVNILESYLQNEG